MPIKYMPKASAPRGRTGTTFPNAPRFKTPTTRKPPVFIGDGNKPEVTKKAGLIQPGNDHPISPRPEPAPFKTTPKGVKFAAHPEIGNGKNSYDTDQ